MATKYVPGSAGWSDNGIYGDLAKLRLKLQSSYDAASNHSTLTVTLQCRAPNFGGRFWLLDNALLRLNGGTFFSGGGSGLSALSYYVDLQGDEAWHDLCDGDSGQPLRWTLGLDHDASGRAEAELELTARLYKDQSFYLTFFGLTGTAVFTETRSFTLTISAGTGCGAVVRRGAASLPSGSSVAYGDSLSVFFYAEENYELATHTVNGNSFDSGGAYTVDGDVAVAVTAVHGNYLLRILAGPGCLVKVMRNGIELHDGARLHDGEHLGLVFQAEPGWELVTRRANGIDYGPSGVLRVTGPVTVEAEARRLGRLLLDDGSGYRYVRALADDGQRIVPVRLFYDRGDRYEEL